MNFNTFGIALLLVGVVLVYSALKAKDPRDIVREALGRQAKEPAFIGPPQPPFIGPPQPATWKPAPNVTAPPTTVWTSV